MSDQPEFELRLIESPGAQSGPVQREGIVAADLETTPEEALAALQATKGAEKIIDQVPAIVNLASWFPTARFKVCGKFGTARYLDVWDSDQFDGFTDMQRCLDDCRVWFSGDGYQSWGSAQTKTGRINAYFTAPTSGTYTCNVRLQSYPASSQARVECLIDDDSFGPLPVNGTIDQPHVSNLGAGGHHFRIRQLSGSFFFLSLTVWKIG